MPEGVRLAVPADEDALYDLLLGLEADNGIGYPHSPERVRAHIEMGTRRKGGIHGVIDAPDVPGRLAASVGIVFGQPWYADIWFWQELWLFVRPEYRRGTGYSEKLMAWGKWYKRAFEKAQGSEVPLFTSVTSRHRLAHKMRWWGRHGEMIGAIFLLR